jgi:hypothetical protein
VKNRYLELDVSNVLLSTMVQIVFPVQWIVPMDVMMAFLELVNVVVEIILQVKLVIHVNLAILDPIVYLVNVLTTPNATMEWTTMEPAIVPPTIMD